MESRYPSRPQFFACKFGRLLTKSAAAMEIGADACWLLMVIALQEDSARYRKAVDFWNQQLMALCGFGGKHRLINCRNKAVDHGWLHYEPGGKGRPAKYWVKIPKPYSIELDSGPCFENDHADLQCQNGTANTLGAETALKPAPQPDGNRHRKPDTSLPIPNPNPKEKRFSYSGDFERFWNAYPSGRKTGKKDALKAWKQALNDTDAETIIKAAIEYANSDVGRGEYVKGPSPWLRAGCWDDDRSAWNDKAPAGNGSPVTTDDVYGEPVRDGHE